MRSIGIPEGQPDRTGKWELSPRVASIIQKAEYAYYFPPGREGILKPPSDTKPTFLKDHPVNLVQEDLDVFGDGSVMIVSTPGHTPGHQSCLVHISKTGWVLLTGDAVHLQENWDNLRIPYFATIPPDQQSQSLFPLPP